MTFWGQERDVALRSHVPAQGRRTRVYLALLPEGVRTKPTEQTLIAGGYTATVTINAVTLSGGSPPYMTAAVLTQGAVNSTFSTTLAAGDTPASVARRLIAAINKSTAYRACNFRNGNGAARIFDVIGAQTFTLAPTGTTTVGDVSLGTVNTTLDTAPAKGATSISLPIALKGGIPAGTWLQFVSPIGVEFLARVSVSAVNGATGLTVDPLYEAIPAGSSCIYPPEFSGRREASLSSSYEATGFRTFNTGGFEDAVFTGSSAEFSLGGLYNEFDAAYRTVSENATEGREFYAIVEYGNKKDGYTRPRKETIVMITSDETPLAVDGLIEASFSAKVLQAPTTIFSAPE